MKEQKYGSRRQSCGSRCCGRFNANIKEVHFREKQCRGMLVAVGIVGGLNRGGIINLVRLKPISATNCNGLGNIVENVQGQRGLRIQTTSRQDATKFMPRFNLTMMLDDSPEDDLALNEDMSLKLINAMHSTLMLMRLPPHRPYVEDIEELLLQSNVSYVRNVWALMSILDELQWNRVYSKVEDTRDMAEIPRKKIMEKMQSLYVRK
ncbi:hypothetical protein Tco_0103419 [Tanacetum coccineum]